MKICEVTQRATFDFIPSAIGLVTAHSQGQEQASLTVLRPRCIDQPAGVKAPQKLHQCLRQARFAHTSPLAKHVPSCSIGPSPR